MSIAATAAHVAVVASTGRTVLLLVVALVVLGLAMVALSVWLVRSTRRDHAALGPLEVMGERSFRRAGEDQRSDRLQAVRPAHAPPPAPILQADGSSGGAEAEADGGQLERPVGGRHPTAPEAAPVTPRALARGDEAR